MTSTLSIPVDGIKKKNDSLVFTCKLPDLTKAAARLREKNPIKIFFNNDGNGCRVFSSRTTKARMQSIKLPFPNKRKNELRTKKCNTVTIFNEIKSAIQSSF